jgi:DeoR/GlpR family transcriptional regulator of sugar metabolism
MSRTDLLLRQRQTRIVEMLETQGRVIAGDLALEFGVSEDTVRRDLREMAAQGLCERVYGGALPLPKSAGNLALRSTLDLAAKARLAQVASREIRPGMTVFFDAGSTNLAIAQALAPQSEISAITNAPLIATALMERQIAHITLIGGQIDHHVGGTLGARAIRDLDRLNPDLCILGACGIDAVAGISAFSAEDAAFKEAVADCSASVMVAVTADKLGTAAPFKVMASHRCHCVITESNADPTILEAMAGLGIRILLAPAAQQA